MQITHGNLREALGKYIGSVLTPEVAATIEHMAFDRADYAIDPARFAPQEFRGLTFAVESFRAILIELDELHRMHFAETELHLQGVELDPDYPYLAERERMGTLLQFTARDGSGRLAGNLRVYLGKSLHTGRHFAEEDTIYLVPTARRGRNADAFMDYAEGILAQLGCEEARADTKLVNRAGQWLQRRGYSPIATRFIKLLRPAA